MNGFEYNPDPLGLESRSKGSIWGSLKSWFNENLLPGVQGALNRTLGQIGQPPMQQATGINSQNLMLLIGLYLITRK